MKRKRNQKGFTLVEVLVATAILAIFVSMAVVGTSALFGTGEQMMTVAKAAVLGSDVMKAITNEIRFGENFSQTTDGATSKMNYDSTSYGKSCCITVDGNGLLTIVQTQSGKNAAGEPTSIENYFYPIGSAAYDEVRINSITLTVAPASPEEGSQSVSCTLSIVSAADGNVLWEKSVIIVPLYQKTVA